MIDEETCIRANSQVQSVKFDKFVGVKKINKSIFYQLTSSILFFSYPFTLRTVAKIIQ